jgi:hypothetical protein
VAFDPQIACENLKEWGAIQENVGRSKGWIFQKNGKYLVVHESKRDVVVSVNDQSASGNTWVALPADFRAEVLKQEGSGKAVVKQYLGKSGQGILVLKFSNANDMKTVFDWYTG